jgi:hypothetical protein
VVLLLIGIFTVVSGVGALMVGSVTTVSMAIKVGFGTQGTIKGLLTGAREAITTSSEDDA